MVFLFFQQWIFFVIKKNLIVITTLDNHLFQIYENWHLGSWFVIFFKNKIKWYITLISEIFKIKNKEKKQPSFSTPL